MSGESDSPAPAPQGESISPAGLPGPGFRVGEYTLVQELGRGAMATVFRAVDATGHEVAIKLFQEGPSVSPTLLERFRREVETAKKLRRHPHIMKVYATGRQGPLHFLVMELIPGGRTLEDVDASGPDGIDRIVSLGAKVARALHFAHQQGVIHRDVKPTNVMINEFDEPLLTDFGVAALVDLPALTLTGTLMGTPLYMSPEQARGEAVGPESDVYALGVVLYEALTGALPYAAGRDSPVKLVLESVKAEIPVRPQTRRADLSPELEAVLLKAIEKSARLRYATADDLAADLERVRTGRRVEAPRVSRLGRGWQWMRQHDEALAVAGVVVLLAGAGLGYLYRKVELARYDHALSLARIRAYVLRGKAGVPAGESTGRPQDWHLIREGRRLMDQQDWAGALASLREALENARYNDARIAAIAQIEEARCQTMLENDSEALRSYREVILNPDAPPTVAEQAHFETVCLHLLSKGRTDANYAFGLRALPDEGALRQAMLCLINAGDPRELTRDLSAVPPLLRNDVLFAAAVRWQLGGRTDEFYNNLRACEERTQPPGEWPAPFARMLLESEP